MDCPYIARKCTKCGEILVACEMNFYKRKDDKLGFRKECKKCRDIYVKEWTKKNKEHRSQYMKKYKKEHKKEIKRNKLKYSRSEKGRKKQKIYHINNPMRIFNSNSRRRMREENQGKGITMEQWKEMMNFFDWKCAYSGKYLGGNNKFRSKDHIIPLNKGGEHEIWNLVPMHFSYNSSKRDNDMLEWYTQQEYFSEERLRKIYEWQEYAKAKWYDIEN